jgi:hypothetical protein
MSALKTHIKTTVWTDYSRTLRASIGFSQAGTTVHFYTARIDNDILDPDLFKVAVTSEAISPGFATALKRHVAVQIEFLFGCQNLPVQSLFVPCLNGFVPKKIVLIKEETAGCHCSLLLRWREKTIRGLVSGSLKCNAGTRTGLGIYQSLFRG